MSITMKSLSSIPTSYATVSLGTSQTPLPEKLKAIADAGWEGIELGFSDLLSFASQHIGRAIAAEDYQVLENAGKAIRILCDALSLKIVMLQPFANFEGWAHESKERAEAFTRAKGWIKIMQSLDCDMLQVGSTDSIGITKSRQHIVADLRELADLLSEHGLRMAYENWCWSTHAPGWKDVWDIVKMTDRPNVGLCLDTFQTAGGEWADPTTGSGLREDQGSRERLEENFRRSLEVLSTTIPGDKIYILQISDAYKRQISAEPDTDGLAPRAQWSMNSRPMPFDGGYLPIVAVTKAILKTGFRGWFSMEIFDGGPDGDDDSWTSLPTFTTKAMNAHNKLLKACTID